MATLEVLIPTHTPAGLDRIVAMDLPVVSGVGYVVSWQNYGDGRIPPPLAARDDVRIVKCDRPGVSANRNNALDHARADILLIGDDDLVYTPAQLKSVISVMDRNPEVDYASFRYDGADNKTYPEAECDLGHRIPKGFNQTTFEIALRRKSPAGALRFNELFGPGAPVFTAAEDEIMFLTARKHHVNMRFFPITITTHPGVTTGFRAIADSGVLLSSGAVIAKAFPFTAVLRLPLTAWRIWRGGRNTFFKSLRLLLWGAVKSIKVRL
ncbi:MAG: glycosyltransferase family 2 protein [Bacteroides sp.]|nr:glycosyltransferase family 2 protein [Bacteroides sp.]